MNTSTTKVFYNRDRRCWVVRHRNQLWYFATKAQADACARKSR